MFRKLNKKKSVEITHTRRNYFFAHSSQLFVKRFARGFISVSARTKRSKMKYVKYAYASSLSVMRLKSILMIVSTKPEPRLDKILLGMYV
jgi:hypothetical protein